MCSEVKKYFRVKCKCGHVGRNKFYIPINFAIQAKDKKDAAEIARWRPRCKHHHKDCILEVEELSYEQYKELIKENDEDPYLKCTSKRQQKMFDLSSRIVEEPHVVYGKDKEKSSSYMYGKVNIRHPKKYMKSILDMKEAYNY